jgi:hypothetical protein
MEEALGGAEKEDIKELMDPLPVCVRNVGIKDQILFHA